MKKEEIEKFETPYLDKMIEYLQNHIEHVEAITHDGIPETRAELLEYEKIKKALEHFQKEECVLCNPDKQGVCFKCDKKQEQKGISAEEFLKSKGFEDKTIYGNKNRGGMNFKQTSKISQLLKEYANQSQSNEVSDEDIMEDCEDEAIRLSIESEKDNYGNPTFNMHDFIEGAKWMQSRQSSNDGWISVEDRLPEESGFYICYIEEITDLGISKTVHQLTYNKEHEFDKWNVNNRNITGVRFWQPLPQPPKQ